MDFHTRVNNAEVWFSQAFQMFEASKALFYHVGSRQSSMELSVGAAKGSAFLLGISLENAFKGVLVKKGLLKTEGNKLKKKFTNSKAHNLSEYINLIDLDLNEKDLELLHRLSIYTTWAGKYNAPIHKNELLESEGCMLHSSGDFNIAEDLLSKLKILAGCSANSKWPDLNL